MFIPKVVYHIQQVHYKGMWKLITAWCKFSAPHYPKQMLAAFDVTLQLHSHESNVQLLNQQHNKCNQFMYELYPRPLLH